MALTPARELTVDEDDLAPLAREVAVLSTEGAGWINLVPQVEPGHEPQARNPLTAIFSARGEAVPLATWSAPEEPGGTSTVGVEHGSGPQALARLRAAGLELPAGWRKLSDHPRRGLVVRVAADADPADVVWWLLTATHALSVVPLTGEWLAQVYQP